MPSESIARQMQEAHRRYIDSHGKVRHKRWMSSGAASLAMKQVRSVDRLTKREGFLTIERKDIDGPIQNYLSASWYGYAVLPRSCNRSRNPCDARSIRPVANQLSIGTMMMRCGVPPLKHYTVMGQPSIGMTLTCDRHVRYRHFHLNPVDRGEIENLIVPRSSTCCLILERS